LDMPFQAVADAREREGAEEDDVSGDTRSVVRNPAILGQNTLVGYDGQPGAVRNLTSFSHVEPTVADTEHVSSALPFSLPPTPNRASLGATRITNSAATIPQTVTLEAALDSPEADSSIYIAEPAAQTWLNDGCMPISGEVARDSIGHGSSGVVVNDSAVDSFHSTRSSVDFDTHAVSQREFGQLLSGHSNSRAQIRSSSQFSVLPSAQFVTNLQLEQQHIRATRQSAAVMQEPAEDHTAGDPPAARDLASFFANVAQARLHRQQQHEQIPCHCHEIFARLQFQGDCKCLPQVCQHVYL